MNIEECNDCLTLRYKFSINQIILSFTLIGLGIILLWISGKIERGSWILVGMVIVAFVLFLLVILFWCNNIYEFLISPISVFDRAKGEFLIQKRLSTKHKQQIYQISDIKSVCFEIASYYNPDLGNMGSFCITLLIRGGSTNNRLKDTRLVISGSIMDGKSQKILAERVASFLGVSVTTIGS